MKQTHTHFISVCIAETLVAETFVPLGWVRVATPEASDVGLSWVTRLGNIVLWISARVLWVRVYPTDWEFVQLFCMCFVELVCDCSSGALFEMLKKSGVSGPLLWVIWLL